MNSLNPNLIRFLAALVTSTAVLMTSVAALQRGGTLLEQTLLVTMSVVMVLGVHFLPAISRRWPAWVLWIGCFCCAIYGHLTFLTHSTLKANMERAQQSVRVRGVDTQMQLTREALAAITARPVTVVAADLAQHNGWKQTLALREELKQAKRADALRNDLIRLASNAVTAEVTSATDPVIDRIALVTGWSEASITVGIGMLFSLLLELTGAFLWYEVTRSAEPVADELADLRDAIETGECALTVRGIRDFLNCSQQRAMEVRRQLI